MNNNDLLQAAQEIVKNRQVADDVIIEEEASATVPESVTEAVKLNRYAAKALDEIGQLDSEQIEGVLEGIAKLMDIVFKETNDKAFKNTSRDLKSAAMSLRDREGN